jgi:hypothetical protein
MNQNGTHMLQFSSFLRTGNSYRPEDKFSLHFNNRERSNKSNMRVVYDVISFTKVESFVHDKISQILAEIHTNSQLIWPFIIALKMNDL